MSDTENAAATPDVADSIGGKTPVHQQQDPDERRLQIVKGDITLVVTIVKGKRISTDALEKLETDVQAIFKRARKELQTVGEKILAVGEQIQIEGGQLDDKIAKAVNCAVDNHLWSTSVV